MEDKYKNYSVEDFAADQEFVQWVKNPKAHTRLSWERWLQQHPDKKDTVLEARAFVQSLEFSMPADTHEAVQNVWERIRATNAQNTPAIPIYKENTVSTQWWKWAAALTGFLMVAGALLYSSWQQPATYRTEFAETKQLHLPDGSVVTLNANSSLRMGNWENEREVWLQGEAFFSVRKQKTNTPAPRSVKFIVHVGEVDVNVLGTEFTVSDHSKTTVVLNEGKIELTLRDKSIIMSPGDLVEITPGEEEAIRRTVNPVVYSSWKDNEWILDGLTLKEVAKRIEDTYGLKVVIKNNPDTTTKITGVVPTDNLDKLLAALSAVFDLKFKRQGAEVVIE